MIGFSGKHFRTSFTLICSVFHLNIKVPFSDRTLQHSRKHWPRYSFQSSLGRTPYFCASQLVFPAFRKCGGSKITRGNRPSSKGRFRQSQMKSGFISSLRPSQSVVSTPPLYLRMQPAGFSCRSRTFESHSMGQEFSSYRQHSLRVWIFSRMVVDPVPEFNDEHVFLRSAPFRLAFTDADVPYRKSHCAFSATV